jgi:hypothetical protein
MKGCIILGASLYLIGATISQAQTSTLVCEQALRIVPGAGNATLIAVGSESCAAMEPLFPFTHEAQIPASADMGTIRFAGIKFSRVATEVTLTADPRYCKEVSLPDPGGSEFCPQAEFGAFEPAYEVTYSYTGPPLASDEHGNTQFTFNVYFRPADLNDKQRAAISEKKYETAAEWFELTKSRRSQRRMIIDEQASTFCPGSYVDGLWTHEDPECQDKVVFKVGISPSPYVTVRVNVDQPTQASALEQ